MWLFIFLVVILFVAIGGGTWGRSRYGSWSWSPAAVIITVAAVLFLTGHLALH